MKAMRSVRTGGSLGRPKEMARRAVPGTLPVALLVTLAFLAALLVLGAGTAGAEPYFSVRDGYKCSKCHVNKTGGGKRTDYAKVYMATRMAMTGAEQAADGTAKEEVGTGRLNEFISVSADVRQVAEYRKFKETPSHWQFGRQSSCEGCHVANEGGGKLVEIYEQLELMPGKASIVLGQSLTPSLTNRESFGLLEFGASGMYLKTGIFRMPTGFRNTWDDPYLHGAADAGNLNLVGLTAVRGDGVEMGWEPGPFSVSVSVTNPGALGELGNAPRTGKRVHLNAYAVTGLGMAGVIAYKDPLTDTFERSYTAVYAGFSLGRITALGELDLIKETDSVAKTTLKMSSTLGQLDFLLSRGQNLKLQYEAIDPDTEKDQNISDRTSLIYEPFIAPYLQARVGARRYVAPRDNNALNGTTVFAEVHLMY